MTILGYTNDGTLVSWGGTIVGPRLSPVYDRHAEYETEIAVSGPELVKIVFSVERPGSRDIEGRSIEAELESCQNVLGKFVAKNTQQYLCDHAPLRITVPL